MSRRLCPDWSRKILAAAAAAIAVLVPGAMSQVAVIAGCAAIGLLAWNREPVPRAPPRGGLGRGHAWAAASLILFGFLLVLLPLAATWSGSKPVAVFGHFYRAGSLVFGGGHVVLPLLRSAVVQPGWIDDGSFLAGYGAAQALPGPLFTFAGYLGTLIRSGTHPWMGGVLALLAIFLPGWLLVGGAFPFWHLLRARSWAQGLLRGANAAVVGLLFAALYRPVCTEGIRDLRDAAASAAALVLLGPLRLPPWVVVGLMAAVGQWVLR
jgi:chromate transporter